MSVTRKEARCPFPDLCSFWGGTECSIKTKEKPLIVCSMAELKNEGIEFTKKKITEYLDRHIRVWEQKRRYSKSECAAFFVDAYQKVRKDIIGEELAFPTVLNERDEQNGVLR